LSKLFLIVLTFFITFQLRAQQYFVGVGGGLTTYWGDLNAGQPINDFINNSGFNGQLFFMYRPKPFISARLNVSIGQMNGDDRNSAKDWQLERNLRFTSRLNDFSARIMIHPFELPIGSTSLTPFISSGLSITSFDPTTTFGNTTFRLQPLGTEGQGIDGFSPKYSLSTISAPFGGGLIFKLNERISLMGEAYVHFTNSDYLDDVSTNYVAYNQLLSGNGIDAARLSDRTPEYLNSTEPSNRSTGDMRGSPAVKDYFFLTNISLVYKFKDLGNVFRRDGNGRRKSSRVICPSFD